MASCVRNTCAKNRQNPLILLKVTIDNVGSLFIETQCMYDKYVKARFSAVGV